MLRDASDRNGLPVCPPDIFKTFVAAGTPESPAGCPGWLRRYHVSYYTQKCPGPCQPAELKGQSFRIWDRILQLEADLAFEQAEMAVLSKEVKQLTARNEELEEALNDALEKGVNCPGFH